MGALPLPEPGLLTGNGEYVAKVTEHWVVVVTHMIFNDRICIARHEEYGQTWTAGWCYPRNIPSDSLATVATAAIWDPETEIEPPNYMKCAYDVRKGSLL